MNMLSSKGLTIDTSALGNTMMLIGVSSYYKYQDNIKTDQVLGYKYSVILPEKSFEQMDVKIEGKKLLDCKAGESFRVRFTDLKVVPYVQNRNGYTKVAFSASASGVDLVE